MKKKLFVFSLLICMVLNAQNPKSPKTRSKKYLYNIYIKERWKFNRFEDAVVVFTIEKKLKDKFIKCQENKKKYLTPRYKVKIDSIRNFSNNDNFREFFRYSEKSYDWRTFTPTYTKDSLKNEKYLFIPKVLGTNLPINVKLRTFVSYSLCEMSITAITYVDELSYIDSLLNRLRFYEDSLKKVYGDDYYKTTPNFIQRGCGLSDRYNIDSSEILKSDTSILKKKE